MNPDRLNQDDLSHSTEIPPVVGLSLELGTTIINHVVPGTRILARLKSEQRTLQSNFRNFLQRGHVICSVNGDFALIRKFSRLFITFI